ncbi:MAG: Cof-type HAD-IIB family hydrolase [Cardiobacteriaceae bacterium]|nr:Cof-type HAD-IIB family hydrolase [Cardiobacteriaceae bacterium]
MNIQAIFSDIDGTLINSQHQISPRTLLAIRQVLGLGIPFTLVSARPPKAITPFTREIGGKQALIAFNGALILDDAGKALYSVTLPDDDVARLEALLERNPAVSPNYYAGQEWYSPNPENFWTQQEGEITHLQASPKPQHLSGVHKILVMGEAEEILALEQMLKPQFPHLHIHRSKPTYLEIVSPEATKAKALDFMAKRLGISAEHIMAFGDNFNDLDMLHYAGLGVVMGNAPDEIKAQIPHHTASNDNDGLALCLESYFSLKT